MEKQQKRSLALKFIIGFYILNLILFIVGQGGAVVAYDTVAQWGLQEARESIDPIIVVINRGIGLGDFMIAVPLFIVAIIGLWQGRFYGIMTSFMVLGISFYWTMIAWMKQHFYILAGVKCEAFDAATHGVLAFVFLFSLWASWYLYKNRKLFD